MSDLLTPTVPCRACGAPMHWATSVNGVKIPLDPAPVASGNLRIDAGAAIYDRSGDGPRYTSHFATCSAAGTFRKRSGATNV